MNKYPLITAGSRFDAVILADGDYPSHHTPRAILSTSSQLVCCDGAAIKAIENGLEPTAVVGDGDSLPKAMRETLGNKLHIVSEQDYNDLTKATRFVLSNIIPQREAEEPNIAYIATTGKREDHTITNIFLLPYFLEELHVHPTIITDHGYFSVAQGCQTFETFPRQQVSIFNISCHKLLGSGLRWQTYPYNALWQGALNEATGSKVTIDADGTYILFRTFEGKMTKQQ